MTKGETRKETRKSRDSLLDDLRAESEATAAAGLRRRLRTVSPLSGAECLLDGRRVVDFSGNDTLGLSRHPAVLAAAREGVDRFGAGSGASRLVSGNLPVHAEAEREAAAFLGRERALLFASGYMANTGAVPALAGRGGAVVLSDELNHASLIDGIRLARAGRRIYPHNDVEALRSLLEEVPAGARILVVTESLFSMEGDRAPLKEIAALKTVRPFLLYVDEAHALGAAGPGGRGIAAEAGCSAEVDVILGTLGKAFGVSGAFVAARGEVIDLLVDRARTFVYTTAPPPAAAAAAAGAIRVAGGDEGRDLRRRLHAVTARFRALAASVLGREPPGRDHIVPVLCPGAERVMEASAALLERGVYCLGIRPPTVPPGRERLRFALSALHEDSHLEQAAAALEEVFGPGRGVPAGGGGAEADREGQALHGAESPRAGKARLDRGTVRKGSRKEKR